TLPARSADDSDWLYDEVDIERRDEEEWPELQEIYRSRCKTDRNPKEKRLKEDKKCSKGSVGRQGSTVVELSLFLQVRCSREDFLLDHIHKRHVHGRTVSKHILLDVKSK
ncbi:hypothetical protein MAR_005809, partial [Mya arenaria]